MYLFSIVLFTVTSLNYVARPPGPSDPNLDQNYDILHAPNRVRSEIRKDPSVTLFFGRTSLSNRNIVLAILLLAGDVHPNPGPINRETIYPCGDCQQHVLPCADKTLYFAKFSKCVFLYNPYLTNLFYLVSKDFS